MGEFKPRDRSPQSPVSGTQIMEALRTLYDARHSDLAPQTLLGLAFDVIKQRHGLYDRDPNTLIYKNIDFIDLAFEDRRIGQLQRRNLLESLLEDLSLDERPIFQDRILMRAVERLEKTFNQGNEAPNATLLGIAQEFNTFGQPPRPDADSSLAVNRATKLVDRILEGFDIMPREDDTDKQSQKSHNDTPVVVAIRAVRRYADQDLHTAFFKATKAGENTSVLFRNNVGVSDDGLAYQVHFVPPPQPAPLEA